MTYPLRRMRGNSVMFRNCLFTDEPIILCEKDEPKLIVMDSRVFARAYGVYTKNFDMQQLFADKGMDITATATQIKKIENLIAFCESVSKPVVVSKYGWDVVVAMNPAEYEKMKHLF